MGKLIDYSRFVSNGEDLAFPDDTQVRRPKPRSLRERRGQRKDTKRASLGSAQRKD